MAILDHYGAKLEGAEVVVIGRSRIVGKPLAQMLLARHATVTMCHTRTRDLAAHTRRADVLCVAVGRAGLITAGMVKPGAWVIDVGNTQLPTGQWVGDVDFPGVSEIAHVTPVPGGVGPMTRAMLLRNTLLAAEQQLGGGLCPPSDGRRAADAALLPASPQEGTRAKPALEGGDRSRPDAVS
jgi:methylenetetrahydrofolate dehydrogenase (NADP+)/methenyltetrahydrofolate cyclohydrolase